jgi:hypothetical protein
MKARTHHEAARRGFPGEWTCEDAEAARLQANQTARPWGTGGPTPSEVWEGRRRVADGERSRFTTAVQLLEQQARRFQGYAADALLDRTAQAAVNRVAIREALVAWGLLTFLS